MTDSERKAMYRCATCKGVFTDAPGVTNNAGSFCPACYQKTRAKIIETQRQRISSTNGTCKYCGDKDARGTWHDKTVCHECVNWRDRGLRLIRHSSQAARYIEKTESREAPARDAKIAEREAAEKQAIERTPEAAKPPEVDRMERLEKMMLLMAKEFGVNLT